MTGVEVAAWLGKALSAGAEKVITGSGVAAIGRLIGAAADIPASYMEGVSQGIRDRADARSAVTKALAETAAMTVSGDPAVMNRALNNMLHRQYRIQENKEAVAKIAIESLESSPPEDDKGGPSNQFMTNFERYAEDATDDDIRLMFGRLLADEIRRPGAVSSSTLHFVSVLDPETANLIQRVLPVCSTDSAFLDNLDPKLNVAEITYLEQCGFWSAEKFLPVRFSDNGTLIRLMRPDEGYVCLSEPGSQVKLNLAILSRAGRDLLAATKISFNYEAMAKTYFDHGAYYFHAGEAKFSGENVSIPSGDIFRRTKDGAPT